ncbi:MAG: hypothetical protein QOI85_1198 [Chloroflexota bacterium]|nr:hypothetical protein [Chloroflexota bacterium]
MSRLARAAARLVLRAYPHAWRDRYGAEVRDLIEDTDAGIGDVVDLAAGAARQHITGGAPMRFEPARRHPLAFAMVAFVVMAPTLVFLTLSLIGHELGISAVASVVDPIIVSVTKPRVVDLALVGAPLVALALAVLPLVDLRVESGDEGPTLTLRIRALAANVIVAAISLLLGALLVGHIVAESVLGTGA